MDDRPWGLLPKCLFSSSHFGNILFSMQLQVRLDPRSLAISTITTITTISPNVSMGVVFASQELVTGDSTNPSSAPSHGSDFTQRKVRFLEVPPERKRGRIMGKANRYFGRLFGKGEGVNLRNHVPNDRCGACFFVALAFLKWDLMMINQHACSILDEYRSEKIHRFHSPLVWP